MLQRSINSLGQKDLHITTPEDRSLPYKQWIRQNTLDGFFMDLDSIKWKREGENLKPCAIIELTRTDDSEVGDGYLKAIIKRYFETELQGRVIRTLSEKLQIPAYIVLFQAELNWFWVYSFRVDQWRKFTKEKWAEYLRTL